MATILKAGNSTDGLKLTPDNTGILQLNTGTGAGTTALTLNESQNATFAGTVSIPSGALITESMTLLGTLTTTSGTTQVLNGLTLTSYKSLYIVCDGVSFTGTTALLLGGQTIAGTFGSAANGDTGIVTVNLNNGVYFSGVDDIASGVGSSQGNFYTGRNGITNASTSITFSGGTFDAGTILVYGVK